MGALLNKSSANRTAAAPPPPAEDQPKVQTAQTEENKENVAGGGVEAELKPADGGPADAGDAKASSEDVEPAAGSGSVPEVPQVQVSEPPATTCEPLTQTSEEPPPQHGEQSEGTRQGEQTNEQTDKQQDDELNQPQPAVENEPETPAAEKIKRDQEQETETPAEAAPATTDEPAEKSVESEPTEAMSAENEIVETTVPETTTESNDVSSAGPAPDDTEVAAAAATANGPVDEIQKEEVTSKERPGGGEEDASVEDTLSASDQIETVVEG